MINFPPGELLEIYTLLFERFGPQHWWPADSPLEVAIGAILTQNTNWRNVELALENLQRAGALSVAALATLDQEELQQLIRPAGFFRQKARRLQLFARHLQQQHGGALEPLLRQPLAAARAELLGLKGVGPETADSILLYAGGLPSFVIDAYTVRLLQRFGLMGGPHGYDSLHHAFMAALPTDSRLFNEYHALIVQLCKQHCSKRAPACGDCPLRQRCAFGRRNPSLAAAVP